MNSPISTLQNPPSKSEALTRLRRKQRAFLFGAIAMVFTGYSCFRRSDWLLFSAAVTLGVFQVIRLLVSRRRSHADSKRKSV
jgi:hypothetical protein